MATYRSIRRDPDFDAQLSELIYDVRRADEFIEAAEWVLSRNPYEGTRLSGGPVWFLPMRSIPDQPSAVIYYAFNDDWVVFLRIEIV
jgi:hypothetical protein